MANPVPSISSALPAATNGRVPRRFGPRIAVTFAALLASPVVHAQSSGDSLQWIGGTAANTAWTSDSQVWDDINQNFPPGKYVSLNRASGNQGGTFNFFFAGPNSAGYGTDAPMSMLVSTIADQSAQLFNLNYLSFTSNFNPTATTTIASGRTDSLANSLNFTSGWTINDRATSGTVTFNTSATGNYGLYFTINGAGSITTNTGANVVMNLNIVDGMSPGSIAKSDGGTLTLTGNNGYTGGTTVSGGTLFVNGGSTVTTSTGTGAVTVSGAGTVLAGNGVVGGGTTVNSGAILSPGLGGNSVAVLKLNLGSGPTNSGLTLNGDLRVDLVGGGTTAGVNNDQTGVTGLLTLNPTSSHLVLSSVNPAGLALGQKFFIVLDAGTLPVVGTFNGLLQGATLTDPAGDTYTINYLDNGDAGTLGNDISLTVTGVVPEPSAAALLASLGLTVAVGGGIRRVRRAWPITGK